MAVKSAAYHTARIEALYTMLEALEEAPIQQYQMDNAGQRQGITYMSAEEIQRRIEWHQDKLSRINSKGGRALAQLRSRP